MTMRATPELAARARALGPESVLLTSRRAARRKWIARASLSLSLTSIVLVCLVVLRRDKMTIDECMRLTHRSAVALQAQLESLGQLPACLPESSTAAGLQYADDLARHYALQTGEKIIVASSPTIPLILHDSGRCVILVEDGQVHQEWWSVTEFHKRKNAQDARARAWDRQRRIPLPDLP